MRPNHPLQLHSTLLHLKPQPRSIFCTAAAATVPPCIAAQKQRHLSTFTRRTPYDTSPKASTTHLLLRHASTSPSTSGIPPSAPPSQQIRHPNQTPKTENVPPPDPLTSYAAPMSSSPSTPQSQPLTWNAFLALRKTRRRYNLLASLSTSILTTSTGISLLAQQNIESAGVFGLDPFIVLGIATAGSGAVGWLLGPFVGNAVFGFVYRGRAGEIAAKERDLYRRIKLHRVDPSSSSAGNPVPDYYGEKIGSVAEYRTWMKDQRAYNKRRQNFL